MSETLNINDIINLVKESNKEFECDIFLPSLKKEVRFKPMNASHLKAIIKTSVEGVFSNNIFNQTLYAIIRDIIDPSVQLSEITTIDKIYILFQLRNKNVKNTISIEVKNGEVSKVIEEDLNKNPRETFDINDVKFYKKIDSRLTYLVAVDPATGTGLDNSVIQIIEFPTMIQVAEIADNTLDSTKVYAKVKNVCNYISSIGAAVYFSFENNGVGEGIASLYLIDEGEFNAILITGSAAHDTRKVRIGFFTDTRNKMKFALRLKKVIEGRTIKINSKDFLTECKRYIREGQVYRAQPGATDDRISAMMIVLRMIEMMSDFDERAFGLYYSFENVEEQNWKEAKAIEEDLMPLPLFG